MGSETSLGRQLQHYVASNQGVRMLSNGLLDLSETPKHLVEVARRNATESPLLRLPAEIRNRIFEFALSGYDIKIEHDPAKKSNKFVHLALSTRVEYESVGRKKLVRTGHNESPFYLPRVCRMAYSESVTKGYALNSFYIDATAFIELILLLPMVGVWARSLATAHFEAISSIAMPATAYVPYLLYSRICGRSVVSAKFPSVRCIYAHGDYPLYDFASWALAQELGIDDLEYSRNEAQIISRFKGWSCDQFVSLMRQNCAEIEVKGVEIIFDGSPTDLNLFNQG